MATIFHKLNEQKALNEILFQYKNKEYGAYALRSESDYLLKKALISGVALFAVISITPFVIHSLKNDDRVIGDTGDRVLIDVSIPEIADVVKPPKQEPVKAIDPIKTRSLDVPTPSREAIIETPPAKQNDINNAAIGNQNIDGTPTNVSVNINVTTPKAPENTIETPKIDSEKVQNIVDVEAKYNGGIDAFRNKVLSDFDATAVEGDGDVIKSVVTFIVERDGTISNIKATGINADFNKEAERTIKNVKGKWVPAKIGNQNVRSYFRFPIAMQFE